MNEEILIVDDDTDICTSLAISLKDAGYACRTEHCPERVTKILQDNPSINILLLDIVFENSPLSGKDVLKSIQSLSHRIYTVMISGQSDMSDVVESIRLGAFNFLEKPVSLIKLKLILKNLTERMRLEELSGLAFADDLASYPMIGQSGPTTALRKLIQKYAGVDETVLITGESGTGKEVAAAHIHYKSSRGSHPFTALNTAAIPAELVESTLFGHVKGSFTGAVRDVPGAFRSADGGTLFLDEIGDMHAAVQTKVLRALQERKITPVGSAEEYPVNVRIIAATNRDLPLLIEKGLFREDLYYRINVLPLELLPLRKRRDDIIPLADFFLKQIASDKHFSEQAKSALIENEWKGNIRELKNFVTRTALLSESTEISVEGLSRGLAAKKPPGTEFFSETMPFAEAKHRLEALYIKAQLEKFGNNITKTAEALHMLPNNVSRKIKALGIKE